MEILGFKKQKIWGIPAVINFTLGSMGAGLYIITMLQTIHPGFSIERIELIRNTILSISILMGGLFMLTFEAGNPVKSYMLLRNIKKSWIAREVLFSLLFVLSAVGNAIKPSLVFGVFATGNALLLIISQALIIRRSRAIVSWNVPPVVALFILSGVVSGYALYAIITTSLNTENSVILIYQFLLVTYLFAWVTFLFFYKRDDKDFRQATSALRTPQSIFFTIILGIIVPLLLVQTIISGHYIDHVIFAQILSGTCVIIGISIKNYDFIIKAGFLRKLRLQFQNTD
jgi:DMSO reductase anchor subunit